MKKGPGKFYEKYKKEVEEGLKGNQEAVAQIKTQKIKNSNTTEGPQGSRKEEEVIGDANNLQKQ